MSTAVKGVYAHLDCLVDSIDALKRAGHKGNITVTAPLPRHEIEELIYEGEPSPVRWFTLAGALFGGSAGFILCSLTHVNWPMIIPAGKPLVSIPAFIIIVFEATVLFGCLFTLIGMLWHCRLPMKADEIPELNDPRLSDDAFAIVVGGLSGDDAAAVRATMTDNGAVEVSGGSDA
jgi:molybdopterin-containing oxidoreductase family membrane subunit